MLAPSGNVTIPPELLVCARAGMALTEVETQIVAQLPETVARLLNHIPRLAGVARIVRYQAKNYDGTGRPADDVKGEAVSPRTSRREADWLIPRNAGWGTRPTVCAGAISAASGAFQNDIGVLRGVAGADQTDGMGNALFEFDVRLML